MIDSLSCIFLHTVLCAVLGVFCVVFVFSPYRYFYDHHDAFSSAVLSILQL